MRVREGVDRGKPWRRGGLVMRGEEIFILFCHDIVGIEELVPFSNVHGALRQRLIIQTNGRRIQ